MKARAAILWQQPGKFEVADVELDEPGPTEVLVEMAGSGLCHSDEHFMTGDQTAYKLPIIMGHEGSGIVRQIGTDVVDLEVGDHIITSFLPACGTCRWCASGQMNLCDIGSTFQHGSQPTGGFRVHVDGHDVATLGALGTFADWQVFDHRSAVKIDPSIPLDVVSLLGCGVAAGYGSAVKAAAVQPGDVVLVIGVGGLGMNALQGASISGAATIVAVDTVPYKLERAPEFGATHTFGNLAKAVEFVKSATNGQGADSAILTVGLVTNALIGEGLQAIRKGGTLVLTGLSPETEEGVVPGFNSLTTVLYQKRIQGSLFGMASPRETIPNLLRQYQAGRLKLDELITRRYSLNDIMRGYSDMDAGLNIRGIIDFSL